METPMPHDRTSLQDALGALDRSIAMNPADAAALSRARALVLGVLEPTGLGPIEVQGLQVMLRTRVGAETGRTLYQVIDAARPETMWLGSPELAIDSYLAWRAAAIASGRIAA
jgi:hypothetical protein